MPAPFEPPPYPYDRLADLHKVADQRARRVRRPLDRHPLRPPAARGGRGAGPVERRTGLPASVGSAAYREAAAGWLDRRFGAAVEPAPAGGLRRHQGVRGRRAALAAAARPGPRHRAVPRGQLPLLRHGGDAGRAAGRCPTPRSTPSTRPTPPGRCACGSTRRPTRRASSTTWPPRRPGGAGAGVPVLSDECYIEFTWDGPGRTILDRRHRGGARGPLAVQAVEPRRRAGRVLRRRRSARALPVGGAQARRVHGARAGAGGRRRGVRRRRPRRGPAPGVPEPARHAGGRPDRGGRRRPSARQALSTCGWRRPGATPGAWPIAWPSGPACWFRRASSTGLPVPAMCGSRSWPPTTASPWWPTAWPPRARSETDRPWSRPPGHRRACGPGNLGPMQPGTFAPPPPPVAGGR